ncbi:MAG: protein translocase subunit SecD [Gemmataceae bacterium]
MKRFLLRIIICLVPTLLSLLVVGWAYYRYQYVDGTGFRLGVDLVGGTNLVYEIDETKTRDTKFSKDELAAALKRRIDPADLYNITIRPMGETRVEIILPTGGKHQAEIEQRNWAALLKDAARAYPVEGNDNPYADVDRNDRAALVDAIVKLNPKLDRPEVDAWVEGKTSRGGRDRRSLSSDDVENIKSLISRQGRLEFRILANSEDDTDAIRAATDTLKRLTPDELARLEAKAQEPPGPRRDDGSDFFPVKIPGVADHSYSWVELGKSQLYQLRLNSEALDKGGPLDDQVKQSIKNNTPFQVGTNLVWVRDIKTWSRRNRKDEELGKKKEFYILVRNPNRGDEITGDYLVRAAEGHDKRGSLAIDFTFNADGGDRFWRVTSANKPSGGDENGFKRQLAIIFDGQVMSAPSLISPIRTSGQITGEYTQQEVNDAVRILRAGALPATLKKEPVSETTMGATLGADTVKWGTISVGGAFVAVLLFMMFYYRFAGMVACIALFANLFLTVAFMVLVQAAFTLPGLAGLVLMLGMAVDANVLIYERLREERERGANLAMAIRNGYDRALPTILDTHLSSIFTAIVLYVVGNDQLKGFGISLTLGLVISLFTSLYMTRTIFEIWLYKGWLKDLNFYEGLVKLIHARYWDFMSIRQYWFTATAILTVLGAALFIYRADSNPATGKSTVLNIDFTGGIAYTGQLDKPMTLTDLRHDLERADKPLPDLSVEQRFLSSDEAAGSGKSSYFTVRTSYRTDKPIEDQRYVLSYISRQLEGKLKQLHLEKLKVNRDSTGTRAMDADLFFTNQNGQSDYASPALVQRLVVNAFKDQGLPASSFTVERPTDRSKRQETNDRFSELKLKFSEPVEVSKVEAALKEVQREMSESPQPEGLEHFDKLLAASTRERALYAILASWAAILLYLWFRFGSWTFGAAAVVCLIHDLFFTLGVIAACHYLHAYVPGLAWILGIQDFKIDLAAVAALLTLVGYSVNDTIVVFDRIREVRGKNPALTPQIINDSVNQTLTRTILASTTTFLVVLVLYAIGGEGVKLFAFVMIVGVIVGTYSSIYIASPLLLLFGEGRVAPGQADRAALPSPTATRS